MSVSRRGSLGWGGVQLSFTGVSSRTCVGWEGLHSVDGARHCADGLLGGGHLPVPADEEAPASRLRRGSHGWQASVQDWVVLRRV